MARDDRAKRAHSQRNQIEALKSCRVQSPRLHSVRPARRERGSGIPPGSVQQPRTGISHKSGINPGSSWMQRVRDPCTSTGIRARAPGSVREQQVRDPTKIREPRNPGTVWINRDQSRKSASGIKLDQPGSNQDRPGSSPGSTRDSGINAPPADPGSDREPPGVAAGSARDLSGINAPPADPGSDREPPGVAAGSARDLSGINAPPADPGSDREPPGVAAGSARDLSGINAPPADPGSDREQPGVAAGSALPESTGSKDAMQPKSWSGSMSLSLGTVVRVREKKGRLRAAIPYMPFPLALFCLFLNTFIPGMGTFLSAFTVLCGAQTDLQNRHVCCAFLLNVAAAFIQIVTAVVIVGWIMSIFWGMDMVVLATYREQGVRPQQL
ncbi:protein stum homolog [Pristis pectinata]|uniref:protein stum homolog n=1 Tax=Pristis pectinata TaxID=685728 RepID=UPI00223CD5DA|nr:protein stum homolog [Pristis pectinata]